MKRYLTVIGIAVLVVIVAGIAFIYHRNPPVLVGSCPECFGLTPVAEGIYSDNESGAALNAAAITDLQLARKRVGIFFKTNVPAPAMFICATEQCYKKAEGRGGISKAASWSTRTLIVSPRGIYPTIIAHELAHIELRQVIGTLKEASLPSWFNEGFAVYVSDDRRYLKEPGAADRCRISANVPLPATNSDLWSIMTAGDPTRVYALSACRVARWAASHGGDAGLLALIGKLRAGQDFRSAFSESAES